eukprot:758889-Hanusia_phi.AAC.3
MSFYDYLRFPRVLVEVQDGGGVRANQDPALALVDRLDDHVLLQDRRDVERVEGLEVVVPHPHLPVLPSAAEAVDERDDGMDAAAVRGHDHVYLLLSLPHVDVPHVAPCQAQPLHRVADGRGQRELRLGERGAQHGRRHPLGG